MQQYPRIAKTINGKARKRCRKKRDPYFFPYSIPNRTPFYNEIAVKILRLFTPQGEKEGFFRPARRRRRAGRRTSAPRQARTIKNFHVLRHFFSRAGLTCRRKDIIINVCVEKRPFFPRAFSYGPLRRTGKRAARGPPRETHGNSFRQFGKNFVNYKYSFFMEVFR